MNIDTKLNKPNRLYLQELEDYTICYNPLGTGGIVVLDSESRRLLDLCDGNKTAREILNLIPYDEKKVLSGIELLLSKAIIYEVLEKQPALQQKNGSFACWLHLTNSCNLSCKYCYIHKSKGEMPSSLAYSIIDTLIYTCQVNKLKKLTIKYAGGEPLLRKELLFELIEYVEKVTPPELTVHQSIITNGTLLTRDTAKLIKQHHIGVGISLDEIDSMNPMRIYPRGEGSSRDALRGIGNLRAEGVKPTVLVTITSENYLNLLELTKYFLSEKLNFRFSFERAYCQSTPKLLENLEELTRILIECYELIGREMIDGNIFSNHNFNDIEFKSPKNQVCGAGNNFLAINYDGRIGVCGLGLAKPFSFFSDKQDLLDLLRTKQVLSKKKRSEITECCDCPWIYACAGGCPLLRENVYGSYDTKSPYCDVFRAVLPELIRVKGSQMIYKKAKNTYNSDG